MARIITAFAVALKPSLSRSKLPPPPDGARTLGIAANDAAGNQRTRVLKVAVYRPFFCRQAAKAVLVSSVVAG